GTCLPDGNGGKVCGGCENDNDCDNGEYCSLGNCLDCDRDEDTYDANYNSACEKNGAYWDCNDNDAFVNGSALEEPRVLNNQLIETCLDGVDNNCNGLIDCAEPACELDLQLCPPGGSCNPNGVCEVDETCSNCAGDCGNCCPENLLDYWRVEEGSGSTTTSDKNIEATLITRPNPPSEHYWNLYIHDNPILDQWTIRFDETSGNTDDDALRFDDPNFDWAAEDAGSIEFVMDGIKGDGIDGREIFRSCNTVTQCNNNNGFIIEFDASGVLQVRVRNGADSVTVDDGGACNGSSYLCYVLVTWEIGQPLTIYVNGMESRSSLTSLNAGHKDVFKSPYIFALGEGVDSFVGNIYQFAFYNVALANSNFDIYTTPTGSEFDGFLCGTGAQCGDEVTQWPEECDDGENNNPYGPCLENCKKINDPVPYLRNYWRFEEEVNVAVYDSWGDHNIYLGQLYGGVLRSISYPRIDGISENIEFFEGTDSRADLINEPLIDEGSIVFWVKPNTPTGIYEILNGFNGASNNLKLEIWDDKRLRVYYGDGLISSFTSFGSLNINAWNFVSLSWDNQKFEIMLDGGLDTSNSNGNSFTVDNLKLGASGLNALDSFSGYIDEVAVFDKRLSVAEVNVLLANTLNRMDREVYVANVQVCGDVVVDSPNGFNNNEICDDETSFDAGLCSSPGTLYNSVLNDCLIPSSCVIDSSCTSFCGVQAYSDDGGINCYSDSNCLNVCGGGGYCGNGIVEAGEVCDGSVIPIDIQCSNGVDYFGVDGECSSDCKSKLYPDVCIDCAVGGGTFCAVVADCNFVPEFCTDGSPKSYGYCVSNCCTSTRNYCPGDPPGGYCGDGVLNGFEDCDGASGMCPIGGFCKPDCTCDI
ncbi:hypothetical protein HOM13_02635, partial [Candidatus Woesearchaeota archaeon]|nr:hypothetical protein [Candidatus Woesearchaeota archaeon]